jgi:hypothetical protein
MGISIFPIMYLSIPTGCRHFALCREVPTLAAHCANAQILPLPLFSVISVAYFSLFTRMPQGTISGFAERQIGNQNSRIPIIP